MGHYLLDPLQFEFMRRALVAVVLTGVVSGVLGSYVVLRGHGLHRRRAVACGLSRDRDRRRRWGAASFWERWSWGF